MKLYGSLTSPFARKVRILAIELGLADQLELVTTAPTPLAVDDWLPEKNPLGKIPALETEEGTLIFDSRVICDYLESLKPVDALVPPTGDRRWRVLRLQALGDGILDAGIAMRYETLLRPQELQWPDWVEAQARKVTTGLDQLEKEVDSFGFRLDLGQVAVVCAIGWLRFRGSLDVLPEGPVDFAQRWPKLMNWFERISQRPSIRNTVPPA